MIANPFRGRASGQDVSLDLKEIRRAMEILVCPDHSVELRALPSGRSAVRMGDDIDGLIESVEQIADGASGIYWCLNPCSIPPNENRAARVADIVQRRWMLVDVDPVRPAETSATEIEHAAAQGRAGLIKDYLQKLGWPAPVQIDSGNGAHLLYRIDLGNTPEDQKLIKSVLIALGKKFDDADIKVDNSVHNASRISKLPGTWSRKGPSTRERRHRISRLVNVPEVIRVVSRDQLMSLAGLDQSGKSAPVNPFNGKAKEVPPAKEAYARRALEAEAARVLQASSGERNNTLNRAAFSLGQLVASGHLSRAEVLETLGRAALGTGLDELEITRTIESGLNGGESSPRTIPESNGHAGKAAKSVDPGTVQIFTLSDIMSMHLPPPKWAVPGILSEGLCILAGKPKLGKSFLALNLGITIAAGGHALKHVQVEAGDVLYLSLEDRWRRVQHRARKILGGLQVEASKNLHVCVECPRMTMGGLSVVENWIKKAAKPRLVIVDVWAKFRPISRSNASAYDQDYEAASELKAIGDSSGVSILILHHCKKAAADDVVDEISGTLGLAGAADGISVLTRARSDTEATLFVTGRDVHDQELALKFDETHCTWACTGTAEDRTRSAVRLKVVDALKTSAGGLFVSELAELLELNPASVKKECWRMHQEGQLRKLGSKYLWPGPGTPGEGEEMF